MDAWEQYAPIMVTEIYAMSSASDEAVNELEARGRFLLDNLGVKANPRLQSMTTALDSLVRDGRMDGTLQQLREALLLDELLPSLPQNEPIPQLFSSKSAAIEALKLCLRDAPFGQQATCQAIGLYLSSQWAKPQPRVIARLQKEFLTSRDIYSTILELSQYLVDAGEGAEGGQPPESGSDFGSGSVMSEQGVANQGQPDVTIEVMTAKRELVNAVLDARKISLL
ncbi:TPA: hypothetical protein I8273_004612 [Aeromonas hydrophila]|nr:hypothetical protein [Aeromonas hydrophila]HAT2639074.1 hypothetical protein [Aeromonas hydrophila]HAT3424238.1 hypothetical protein [Aeromonas hydrophila]HAT3534236.1 hypothetical protein [Aeromonas hydrophila]